MKNLFTKTFLIVLFLVLNIKFNAQTYILSPPGGSVFTTCKGFVQNDLCCYDFPFCSIVYYCEGDDHYNTFQSGTPGTPIRINFTYLDLNTGDFVRVYQGVGTGGPLLASFTNTYTSLGNFVTSATGVITIRFTTNSDGNVGDGYSAIVGCPPVGCAGNSPASDICSSATRICDSYQYCGNTGGWYTADNEQIAIVNGEFDDFPNTFFPTGPFCGSIENNSWIVFKANATLPTFSVNVGNCSSSSSGIQMALLNSSNCSTFSAVSSCISQSTAPTSFTIGASTPLTVGNDYYIMIDGYAGNYCDYTVTPMSGVQIATLNASAGSICQNQTLTLNTSNAVAGSTYSWSASTSGAIGSSPINPTIIATPTVVGNTIYTVSITQPNGCAIQTYTRSITLNPLPTANAGTSPSSITCANPTRNLSGSGGGTYAWSGSGIVSGGTTANPTVNGPGPFSLTVTSGAGCTSTNVATVSVPVNTTIPSPLSISANTVLNCSTPTVILNGSPSSGVTYTWSGPSVVSGVNSVSAGVNVGGTYNMSVTSTINGCKNYTTITIAPINNTTTNTPSTGGVITCLNSAITLSTTANTPLYNITWSGPGGSSIASPNTSSTSATSTSGGNFTVSVLNTLNGCTSTSVISANINTTVITPTALASPSGVLNCTNTSVGLTGNPSSGVSYLWSGPSSFTSSLQSPTVATAGVYTLVVTNSSNGCPSSGTTRTVTVTQNIANPTVTANSSTTPTLGCGSSSVVAISVSVNPGGSAINWTSGGGGFIGATNTATANVTTPTTYTANVTHPTSGCVSTMVFTINPSSGASPVNASATSGTVTCTSTLVTSVLSTTGTVSSYNWSGPMGGIVGATNTATVNAQLAGTYTYNITFNNGCTANGNFIVTANNAPVTPNATSSNSVNCNNTSATITSVPSPTSSAYTYSWSTGATANNITVSPTSNTSYTVVVTNTVNGCKGTQVVTVNASTVIPTAVALSPGTFTLSCSPPNTILTASATGASSYSWSSSTGTIAATTNTLSVNAGGTYSVFAVGANGCKSAAQVSTITPPAGAPVITLSNNNPSITCLSSSPSVSVTVTSTVPVSSYTWGPASGIVGSTSSSVVTFSAAGTYTGVITATNGCPTNTIITVSTATTPPSFVAGTGTAQALSCTNTLVTIAPSFTPSSANLTYTWTGLGIVGSTNNSSVQVNQNGTYSLTVTNTLTGCSSTSLSVNVNGTSAVPSLSLVSSSSVGISCAPGTSTITLTASSNASSPTYSWNTGATSNTISTSTAGIYTVVVTNTINGCSTTQTINVSNNTTAPSLTAAAQGQLPCGGGTTTLNAVSTNTNVSYNWIGVGIVSGSNTANAEINTAGVYTVIVTDLATNCNATQTIAVSSNSVVASFTTNTITGPAPLTVNFNNTSAGATSYTWAFGNNQSGSNDVNPSNTFPQGTFTVVLVAQNGACTSTATIEIKVLQGLGEVPEIFTPNGDVHNQFFEIKGLESYPKATLQIFNRWGNMVYSQNPYDNKWDGKPNQMSLGKDLLPSGTYYYILDLKVDDIKPMKGYVQLQY